MSETEFEPIIERCTCTFSGHVQGVGFRQATRRIAARYRVRGYVQNLPDGQVLLVAEGTGQELERFLKAVRGELDRFIQGEHRNRPAATGEFADFSIRH